jgi:hypothetical protein
MHDPLWHGMICLSLAVRFEEKRVRIGVPAMGCAFWEREPGADDE